MPTHRQAGDTRARIVAATERAIREYGIAGATTKRIAQLAGCSEALLYKHFDGKESLVLAVILEHAPVLAPALKRLGDSAGTGDLAANLTEFAVAAVEFYTNSIPTAAGVMTEPALMAGFREMLAANNLGPHMPIRALGAILWGEQQAGRVRPGADCDALAVLLMGACYQRAHLSAFVDLPDTNEAFADTVVRTLLT
ncbi:TetR/AcrR family transcriptional regulator [Nonomuraea longicatena]|uniref:TetR/AcrR family transcriptional regulator n=1 Tax=Nonomuraea longicatena TaxID=83682 RepID=A0ABN1QPV2_9ACTN